MSDQPEKPAPHKCVEVSRQPRGDGWFRVCHEYRTDDGKVIGTGWALERENGAYWTNG